MGTKSSSVRDVLPDLPWRPEPITPLPEVREIPFDALSRAERNSFFAAFADTEPGELA